MEVIVVNDGSTDNTVQIIEQFAKSDKRVHLFSQPNQGLSAARNTGIDNAKGEWLIFVDSDDMLYPDAIKTLWNLSEDYKADIAMGCLSPAFPSKSHSTGKIQVFTPQEAIKDILFQKTLVPSACGKIYHRRIFEKNRFRPGILYEDLDTICDIVGSAARIVYTSQLVYFYRESPGSILHTFNPQRFDVLSVTERIERWCENNYPDLTAAARSRRLSANFNILGLLIANEATRQYPDIAEQCWNLIRNYRTSLLFNPNVRFKNRVGIVASFAGIKALAKILRRHYSPKPS